MKAGVAAGVEGSAEKCKGAMWLEKGESQSHFL